MTINSRSKGKRGELELAEFLRRRGHDTRRGQQFAGGGDSPDVMGLPGFHVECKRVEAGSPYKWLDQAKRDAEGSGNVPIVMHRKSRRDWVVIMDAEDFLSLIAVQGM